MPFGLRNAPATFQFLFNTTLQEYLDTFVAAQAFLGFANFYQKFIQGYSKVVTPLMTLTKKKQPFKWRKEQQDAFHGLKKKFILALILGSFDPEKKIILETDASNQALGSCLCQLDTNERLHPVAYRSRKFSVSELNDAIHDKELLAIVDAFEKRRTYLKKSKYLVEVYLDHKNLSYFTTTKKLN